MSPRRNCALPSITVSRSGRPYTCSPERYVGNCAAHRRWNDFAQLRAGLEHQRRLAPVPVPPWAAAGRTQGARPASGQSGRGTPWVSSRASSGNGVRAAAAAVGETGFVEWIIHERTCRYPPRATRPVSWGDPRREAAFGMWLDRMTRAARPAARYLACRVGRCQLPPLPAHRLRLAERGSLIIMDAPPDREDCRPFVKVAA